MPKIVNYEKKKEEILDKAMKVFINRGYYNTKLSDISSKCGMGRTTLYQYFKNKDEIFYYAINRTIDQLINRIQIIVQDDNLSFIDKIKKIISELAIEYQNNNMIVVLIEIWVIMKRENNEKMKKIYNHIMQIKQRLRDLLNEAIEAKEIKPLDTETMSDTLFSIIQSFLLQSSSNKEVNIQKQLNSLNILIEGLRA